MNSLLVDDLLKYVEEQLRSGYKPEAVRQALVRKGYSPAVVDGVLESIMQKSQQAPVLMGRNHEKSVLGKIVIIILVLGLGVLGAIFLPKLLGSEALLDVSVSPDRLSYHPGEDVGFGLEVYNMGSSEKFDITLKYRILDENFALVNSREETVAIRTSTSHHRSLKIPDDTLPGTYTLKVFANYEGKIATSSFSFSVKEESAPVETCYDNIKNQDEAGVDCGGVCGGYWYDNECHDEPESEPQEEDEPETPVEEPTCNDGVKNQDEVGVDCGGVCGGYWYDGSCHSEPEPQPAPQPSPSTAQLIMDVREEAKTDPDQAKNICLDIDKERSRDKCLQAVAQASMRDDICELITNTDERDTCYYPFFMQGDYSVCEKLTDPQSRESCEQLKQISIIAEQLNQTGNQTG